MKPSPSRVGAFFGAQNLTVAQPSSLTLGRSTSFGLVPVKDVRDNELVAHHLGEARSLARLGAWVLVLGVLPGLAWLTWAPLSTAVVTQGYVKVDLNRRTVQHAEGGTVRAVYVRDGQKVKKGEPLIELGDVSVAADHQRLLVRLQAERAGVSRLEAEQDMKPAPIWTPDLIEAAGLDPSLGEQIRKEQALFVAHRSTLRLRSDVLMQQRDKVMQEMALLRTQIDRSQESIETQRIISDINIKLRGLESDYRQQAGDQLKLAQVRVNDIEQELRKATDPQQRQVIVAPVDGEVMGLKVTTPGMLLTPHEPIADVVPADPRLLVEARIRTEDIKRVHLNQKAELRFTSYRYRTTPLVSGKVSHVSADRVVDRDSRAGYYTVQIEVDAGQPLLLATSVAASGELVDPAVRVQAGMPVEIYLQGEVRTALRYLIEPVRDSLRRAGHER
jgi:multidrug efflux pump subunit AcrA (membrane-fusion protein)